MASQGAIWGHPAVQPALASTSPWLDRLNAWRANAAVPALTENSTYDQGDYDHAVYMVKNDLVTHYETPGVPYYSVAGDTAARNSNIYVSSSTSTADTQAIDWWMGAPFHAMGMMDPRLASTGFGSYREVKSGWDMGAALNVLQGNPFTGGRFPVYFPGDGTSEPLTSYSGNEFPDPLQACSGYSVPTGLPVFIEVGGNTSTTATASSFTGNGVSLAHCVIDSNTPTVGSSLYYRGGVIVIPRAPLVAGVHYAVALTVNGVAYSWSFTVGTLTAGIWSAAFDMSGVPTSWTQGLAQTFSVKVTNTGNMTWPSTGYNEVDLDLHFATSSGGSANQSNWLTSLALPLGADVPPNGTATVTFSLIPPAGATVLEALMIKEHQFWFDSVTTTPQQWASVPVTVHLQTPVWSASFDMSGVPLSWQPGVAQTFSVKVTNKGNVTWPSTGYTEVDMDLHFATSAGGSTNMAHWVTSLALPLGADLAPNATATVTFTIAPPPGATVLEALMIKEHLFWFDTVTPSPQQWAPVNVTVAPAVYTATYGLTNIPATWTAGQSQTFQVTVTNTGNMTWPSTGYYEFDLDFHFTTVVGGSAQEAHWLTSLAYSLPNDLAPGGSVTFNVTVTAPTTKGSMFLEAEMIKEHAFWFTTVGSVPVTIG
jgi:hypothetical protein